MGTKPYLVKQGDYLEKIAHALRVEPDEVWNDPKNADLKQKRDPNLLFPGDILYVPEKEPRWLPLTMGSDNMYVATVPRTKVRIVFKDADQPRANQKYVILGMGEAEDGTTDGDGAIEIQVPVHIREIQVAFPDAKMLYPVRIGDMDPIDEPAGVRKRLQHLGYIWASGGDEGEIDLDTADRLAIQCFQQDQGLSVTGTMDDATRSALLAAHGG